MSKKECSLDSRDGWCMHRKGERERERERKSARGESAERVFFNGESMTATRRSSRRRSRITQCTQGGEGGGGCTRCGRMARKGMRRNEEEWKEGKERKEGKDAATVGGHILLHTTTYYYILLLTTTYDYLRLLTTTQRTKGMGRHGSITACQGCSSLLPFIIALCDDGAAATLPKRVF